MTKEGILGTLLLHRHTMRHLYLTIKRLPRNQYITMRHHRCPCLHRHPSTLRHHPKRITPPTLRNNQFSINRLRSSLNSQ